MSDDGPKLTPFSSRVKEIARDLRMVSTQISDTMSTVDRLKEFVMDVVILADELGPEQQELLHIAEVVGEFLEGLDDVKGQLNDAHDSSASYADRLADKLEEYMDREVTTPYDPIFNPEADEVDEPKQARSLAKKVARRKFNELSDS